MSINRICDFCGYESPNVPIESLIDGYLELRSGQAPHVLRLRMEVDPGVRIEQYEAKTVSYNVCTQCLFSFLRRQEEGLL